MYKIILIIICISVSAFAQIKPQIEQDTVFTTNTNVITTSKPADAKPDWKSKMHYGGNVMLGGGSYGLYVDISPMVGYEITNKGTVAGISGVLVSSDKLAYGARLFVRQPIWRALFAHGELEAINATGQNFYNFNGTNADAINRKWGASPLIGAGFYQGMAGQQKGYFLSVLYNLGYPNTGFKSNMSTQGLVFRIGYFF